MTDYEPGAPNQPLDFSADTTLPDVVERGQDARRNQPLRKEFISGRLPDHLELTADRLERTYRRATTMTAGGTRFRVDQTPLDQLIGAEVVADAQRENAYVWWRVGPALFDVIRQVCIEDAPLWLVASPNRLLSTLRRELTIRGRERVLAALQVCEQAHVDFDAMATGEVSPKYRALGALTPHMPPEMIEAANDNALAAGRAHLRHRAAEGHAALIRDQVTAINGDPVAANDNRARLERSDAAEARYPYLSR